MPVHDVADWTQRDAPPPDEPSEKTDEVPLEAIPEEPDDELDSDLDEIKSKDRVVAILLRKKQVQPIHVKRAFKKQKEDRIKDSLWRVLARINGVDREAIFRAAAQVYAFPEAEIGDGKPDPEFARSVMDTFEEEARNKLLGLLVVPYEVDLES